MKREIDRAEVMRRHRNGDGVQQIARDIGCTAQAIYKIIKDENRREEMDYKNPEGYPDPTPYKAMQTEVMPGDVWAAATHIPEKEKRLLVIQTFDSHAICLWVSDDLMTIPEGCEEKLFVKDGGFCDCSKPQFCFYSRFNRKVGAITLNRLIEIRQKAAGIMLRGFTDGPVTHQKAAEGDFKPVPDKIPTAEEKPLETACGTRDVEVDALISQAKMYKALSDRLLDILEKAVQRGHEDDR